MKKQTREAYIRQRCRDAGCGNGVATLHREQYIKKGWDPHPPATFIAWWEPSDTDEESGASVGGQPEAKRVWARKDQGGWNRRTYGVGHEIAWNVDEIRASYQAWVDVGSPLPFEPFVSIAVPLKDMSGRMARILAMVDLGPAPDEAPLMIEDEKP
jgi:hypothetical protein